MPGVAEVLLRFLPEFLEDRPSLSPAQRRAIRAITDCRTSAMGGYRFVCTPCGREHFAWHSCNHRACPRCGRSATADWVERELGKRVNAPYFLVTFTLPEELRGSFFGPFAKEAYDIFFAAASGAMREKMTGAKGLKAAVSGFTAVLHTWGQQMQFHPHLHLLVPGAGLNADGKVVQVKNPEFLLKVNLLAGAFRQHYRQLFADKDWQVDPAVWRKSWGVHIQPVGSGAEALKYLGNYVSRSVIGDSRIVGVEGRTVTFKYQDRADNRKVKTLSLDGVEFVRRYLRHVLPVGLRSIRYFGFCHPAALKKRERIRMFTGSAMCFGAKNTPVKVPGFGVPKCAGCQQLMSRMEKLPRQQRPRAPPVFRVRRRQDP